MEVRYGTGHLLFGTGRLSKETWDKVVIQTAKGFWQWLLWGWTFGSSAV